MIWSLGKYIAILHRQENRYLNQKIQEYGLKPTPIQPLFYLAKHEGISQKQLCETIAVDESAMTRSIRKLEEQGLVTRRKDPNDLRCYSLYLTEKGREFIPVLTQFGVDFWTGITRDFSDEELILFLSMCERMVKYALSKNPEERSR